MIQVRHGIFETNSSSTHAIVVYTEQKYNLLMNDEAFIYDGDEVVTLDEAKKMAKYEKYSTFGNGKTPEEIDAMSVEEFIEWMYDVDLELTTYESAQEEWWYPFHKTITTESGEVIHVFGSYA